MNRLFTPFKNQIIDGRTISAKEISCDVLVVGSGAGGAEAAFELSKKGHKVILLEEGPFADSSRFKMNEGQALSELYMESAGRATSDRAINILQGRCVGGGTTINWTSSFRTPESTLEVWSQKFGVQLPANGELEDLFSEVEKEYFISPWEVPPNENNEKLRSGLQKLGIPSATISRNVKDCHNLGYCGMGCPVDAKQGTLLVKLPGILKNGGQLIHSSKAWRFIFKNGEIKELQVRAMDNKGVNPDSHSFKILAKRFILSAGAMGSPAVLLRSKVPDPNRLLGKRTFLHPVTVSCGVFSTPIEAFSGAPQVVYSDHFLKSDPTLGPLGFKLEVPPIHPVILSSLVPFHGSRHFEMMKTLPHLQAILSLGRDGFHQESQGGQVHLRGDGRAVLDYPITQYLWDGFRQSYLTMAEIQFASGAQKIFPLHKDAAFYHNMKEARQGIDLLPMKIKRATLLSAHVMGGIPMGEDMKTSLLDSHGRYRHLENLWVMDGSVFPTSVGANPMESILAFTRLNARKLT